MKAAPGRRGLLPVPPAESRPLRIYALDPLAAGTHGNVITVQVPYEALRPGPIGARVEVIDYDPGSRRYLSPVDLDDPHVLARDGLDPSESDPRFHQQMVYAVAMTTLQHFEYALGRRVGFGLGKRGKLRIYPHGVSEANAFFSPESRGLLFGYFRSNRTRSGRNLPGGYVFTCLSHDIVAHETAHALVHGLRDTYLEPSNPDTLAFHEAFADLVALLQHVSLPGVVEAALERTQARLDDIRPLVDLGRQFSEAIGLRGTLRQTLGEPPDPAALARTLEPHERGAILVGAVFAAMTEVYRRRTADLLRIATGGSGVLPQGSIAPDLVVRLAAEARKTASHYLNICIRALDYCPPADIDFGDYLRAAVTADRDLEPRDPWGYRTALIDCCRERGILPRKVFSLAEGSLVWDRFEGRLDRRGLRFDRIRFHSTHQREESPEEYFRLFRTLAARRRNRSLLHLDPGRPVEVRSVRPLRRIGPDRRIHDEVVVQLLQTGPPLSAFPGAPPYRGGTTIIVASSGEIRYAVYKPIGDRHRRDQQKAYLADLASLSGAHAYLKPTLAVSFAGIHRGR